MKWTKFPRIELGKGMEGRIIAVPLSPSEGEVKLKVGTTPINSKFFENNEARLIEHKNKLLVVVGVNGRGDARMFGANAWKAVEKFMGPVKFHIFPDFLSESEVLEGVLLASYNFSKHKSKQSERPWIVFHGSPSTVEEVVEKIRGVYIARDIGNEPGNHVYPESLAEIVRDSFGETKVEVEVFNEARLKKEGFGGLLSVGKGSINKPRLIIMKYMGGNQGDAPIMLVGKGITFDTGGINLKPTGHIKDMKFDVCGAATVIGTMWAVQALKMPINVVGLVPAAENMPSADATRPSDIVKMYNGKTVEVTNTDAEGRMILADALAYGIEKFKPIATLDLATLTGACVVALGDKVAGIMGNNPKIVKELITAGAEEQEKLWELPLFKHYLENMKSDYADLVNSEKKRGAGASNAGKFLEQFVSKNWVHIDIAGPASSESEWEWNPVGGTGFGVRTVLKWLSMHI
ncbi:MAG: leucyl aminopeptidase family protein [Candidatus Altiarchaeota archaeon]|nr:leucyl aminopeptidase family protein [Candidatus Altiarchaeota archaeon]